MGAVEIPYIAQDQVKFGDVAAGQRHLQPPAVFIRGQGAETALQGIAQGAEFGKQAFFDASRHPLMQPVEWVDEIVNIITGKELIAPQAAQHHLDMLGDELRHHESLQQVDLGLLGVPDHLGQVAHRVELHAQIVMLGLVIVRHQLGVVILIGRLVETQSEGIDLLHARLAHHRHDGAGVHPPGEVDPDRHVADQLPLHRLLEVYRDLLQPFPLALAVIEAVFQAEIGRQLADISTFHDHIMRRRQPEDMFEQGFIRLGVAQVDMVMQRLGIQFPAYLRVEQDRFLLGSEDEAPILCIVMQRFDPEVIPGQHQPFPPLPAVEDGEGEDAVQAGKGLRALVGVKLQDHLGIGGGMEAVALRQQLFAQFAVVVDLPVVDDRQAFILVEDRLIAGGQVDDAQAAVPQADLAGRVNRPGIRPTVRQDAAHRLHQRAVIAIFFVYAANTAHVD